MEAVYSGVAVNYRVVDTVGVGGSFGTEYTYSATWRFSSTSTISSSEFTVSSVGAGFSGDDGAWGAGSNVVDAGYVLPNSPNFWGIGNFNSGDSSECNIIRVNGNAYGSYSSNRV